MISCSLKVPIAAIKSDVCLQNRSKSHSYHLKNIVIIITIWLGNGAILKRSSRWQSNEF